MSMWKLTGKTLPVPLSRGYVYGVYLLAESHTWKTFYTSSVYRFIPEPERMYWFHLIEPYHDDDHGAPQPLDYTALRLMNANMLGSRAQDPVTHQRTDYLTFQVGRGWWHGAPPVSRDRDYGLRRLFGELIVRSLEPGDRPMRERPRGGLANAVHCVQAFVTLFQRASQIPMTLNTQPTHLTITIQECPFCFQAAECQVFWGVFTELLDWINGKHGMPEICTFLKMDREQSTSHVLVIDIT